MLTDHLTGIGAAGLPAGLSVAVALAGERLRSTRRRVAALAEVEQVVNGGRTLSSPQPLAVCDLLRTAAARWEGPAVARGRTVSVGCDDPAAIVVADRPRVERAIDNLIANALEHGTGCVRINVALARAAVRIAVADEGPARRAAGGPQPRNRYRAPRWVRWRRGARDLRRGHGLRIVADVARQHGGRFLLDPSADRTEAILELPRTADQAAPAA
jgi:signal transduction histidine kinase